VRYWVLAVFCSLAFLTYLDRICIMRVQGEMERDLGFARLTAADVARLQAQGLDDDPAAQAKLSRDRATERMGWVFSAFLFGYLLFEIPGGWMGDRWGPRRVLTRIVIAWSIFTALTGSVLALGRWLSADPTPGLLLALMVTVRFLFGLGEAGAFPNVARALGRWFPLRERAAAQGTIWLASRFGGAVAPMGIGALMRLTGSWQAAFWVLGGIGVLWAFAFARWFRDRPEDNPNVNELERQRIRSETEHAGSIYSDAPAGMVRWRRLVTSPGLLALYAVSFCMSFCWYFFVTFLPRYLMERHGIDYQQSEFVSGLPLLCGGVACLLGGVISDRLVRRWNNRRWGRSLPGVLGCALAGVAVVVATQVRTPWACLALICFAAACQDFSLPCMWSVPIDVSGRQAGLVGGAMNSVGCLGGMLSPLVAAKLSGTSGWSEVFVVFGVTYAAGALAWACVDASKPVAIDPSQQPTG
jgi:MFS family permease